MRSKLVLGFLLIMVLGAFPAQAERRIALVIGNGAYEHLPALSSPANDAGDLAKSLADLGFDVDLGVDLQLGEMQQKTAEFAKRIATADVALVFFAGHGVQAPDPAGTAGHLNYLLPIDAEIKNATDLSFLPNAWDIFWQPNGSGMRILILDASRDNPITQRSSGLPAGLVRGLAPPAKTPGTYVMFSAQPNQVAGDGDGRNSRFVAALLHHISESGVDISGVFTGLRDDVNRTSQGVQIPAAWIYLDKRFSFNDAPPTSDPMVPKRVKTIPVVPYDDILPEAPPVRPRLRNTR
jgi:uncharacterized caspase-like protein